MGADAGPCLQKLRGEAENRPTSRRVGLRFALVSDRDLHGHVSRYPPSFGPVLHVLQRVQHTTVYISAAKISSGPESGQKRQVQDALKAAMPTIRPPVIIEYFARRTMTTATFSPQQWHSTRSEWPGVARNHFKCSPKRAPHFLCLQQGKFRRNNAPSRTFAAKIFCPPTHQLSTCVSRRPR